MNNEIYLNVYARTLYFLLKFQFNPRLCVIQSLFNIIQIHKQIYVIILPQLSTYNIAI